MAPAQARQLPTPPHGAPRTLGCLLLCLAAQALRALRLVLLRRPRHLGQAPPLLLLCGAAGGAEGCRGTTSRQCPGNARPASDAEVSTARPPQAAQEQRTPERGALPVIWPVRYSRRWYRCAAFSRSSASLRAAASSSRRRVASAKSLQGEVEAGRNGEGRGTASAELHQGAGAGAGIVEQDASSCEALA